MASGEINIAVKSGGLMKGVVGSLNPTVTTYVVIMQENGAFLKFKRGQSRCEGLLMHILRLACVLCLKFFLLLLVIVLRKWSLFRPQERLKWH